MINCSLLVSVVNKIVVGVILLSAILLPPAALSQDNAEMKLSAPPRVALVLGGGGARGAAHIGVLRVLEQEGIPIDYIVGNSMGAVVGGLYSAGVSLEKIQSALSETKAYLPRYLWCRVMLIPVRNLLCLGREKPYAGLESGNKLKKIISKLLPEPDIKVNDLQRRFSCIAFSLIDGQVHVLSEGKMADIIRASATIPLLTRPVEINSNLFVDGGVRNNLPTNEARCSGAQIVVSVETDVDMTPVSCDQFRAYENVFDRVISATLTQLDKEKLDDADVLIRPSLKNMPMLPTRNNLVDEAVRQGELAARKELPRIRSLLKEAGIDINTAATKPSH